MRDDLPSVAILTYHRILPEGRERDFYDLPVSVFVGQIQALARRTVAETDGVFELQGRRRVCLTFDDGTADHHEAASLLAAHGLRGTFFVITGRLGRDGYLSPADVQEMARQGHRIGSHAVSHRRLTKLPIEEVTQEMLGSKRALESLSERRVDWFAPPGGYYSNMTLRAAEAAGYTVVRTMDWGYTTMPLHGRVPCLPVLPRYDLDTFRRLLDGEAPMWLYRLKTWTKRGLGDSLYVWLRNHAAAARKRRP